MEVVGVEVVVVVVGPGWARGRAGRGGEGSQVLIVRAGVDPRRPGGDQHRLRCNNPDRSPRDTLCFYCQLARAHTVFTM